MDQDVAVRTRDIFAKNEVLAEDKIGALGGSGDIRQLDRFDWAVGMIVHVEDVGRFCGRCVAGCGARFGRVVEIVAFRNFDGPVCVLALRRDRPHQDATEFFVEGHA